MFNCMQLHLFCWFVRHVGCFYHVSRSDMLFIVNVNENLVVNGIRSTVLLASVCMLLSVMVGFLGTNFVLVCVPFWGRECDVVLLLSCFFVLCMPIILVVFVPRRHWLRQVPFWCCVHHIHKLRTHIRHTALRRVRISCICVIVTMKQQLLVSFGEMNVCVLSLWRCLAAQFTVDCSRMFCLFNSCCYGAYVLCVSLLMCCTECCVCCTTA